MIQPSVFHARIFHAYPYAIGRSGIFVSAFSSDAIGRDRTRWDAMGRVPGASWKFVAGGEAHRTGRVVWIMQEMQASIRRASAYLR